MVDRRVAQIGESTRRRTVAASTEGDAGLAVLFCIGALVLAWLATYGAGGSSTALPHAFYVPVVICAVRFGHRGALLVSLAAGIAAGPLMPLNVDAGTTQTLGNWLARLVAFVVIGQLTAYLSQRSLPSLSDELAAYRFRNELGRAIDGGQIRLEYQPIVDLATGELAGVEALARWDHPDRGVIGPDEFVGAAERFGCVDELTRHVIDRACRQVAGWRRSFLHGQNGFKLAVNVSATDIAGPDLSGYISEVLDRTGVPNHWLHLEITETALVDDIDLVVERLMELRLLGIRLAIDDFGTGESSLGHLQRYPIDVLKIDRTFVNRVDLVGPSDVVVHGIIAHGIIALAQAMHLHTVAEGIETGGQARSVRDFGCTMGQGYLFSRPLDITDIEDVLENPHWFRDQNLAHLTSTSNDDRHHHHPH